ncbi:LytR/AlgR family response regulator transcription factor [Pedobacter mendelii]|uniref:DNA-binding response regulator n=1 Tax=Pedobacter mendelii TaxID=1908240 RepID=A0ABQ2BHG3_9SPHI|nr:response regulator [Pedobacter mendelii]GGI26298.1 DNA-binding response regulator [Pedobacter mendelii]
MPINCIAIDDDQNSLENLNAYLTKLPDLQLVKSFTDPLKALTHISVSEKVDIIFMDIEMPALSGIELASLLRQKTKHLIFTTAHPKYAIDAFGVDADAYLLKPYSMLHFTKTISNLYPSEGLDNSCIEEDFFFVPLNDEPNDLVKIEFSDLVLFEQINEMVYFRTMKQNYVNFKLSFGKISNMLKKHPAFIQVNSSAIISKLHIKSFLGDQIVLTGGLSIQLANKYKNSFLLFLKENLLKSNFVNDN